jgi:hypothetical protein
MHVRSLTADDGGLSELDVTTLLYCTNPNCRFQKRFDYDEGEYDECPRCGSPLEQDREVIEDEGLEFVDPESAYYTMNEDIF